MSLKSELSRIDQETADALAAIDQNIATADARLAELGEQHRAATADFASKVIGLTDPEADKARGAIRQVADSIETSRARADALRANRKEAEDAAEAASADARWREVTRLAGNRLTAAKSVEAAAALLGKAAAELLGITEAMWATLPVRPADLSMSLDQSMLTDGVGMSLAKAGCRWLFPNAVWDLGHFDRGAVFRVAESNDAVQAGRSQ